MLKIENRPSHSQVFAGIIDRRIWASPAVPIQSKNGTEVLVLDVPEGGLKPLLGSNLLGEAARVSNDHARITLVNGEDAKSIKLTVFPKDRVEPYSWRIDVDPNQARLSYDPEGNLGSLITSPQEVARISEVLNRAYKDNVPVDHYISSFLARVYGFWPTREVNRGVNAIMMAELLHRGQRRKSGEPYIDHPWAIVSEMLEFPELASHPAMINAAWIHDAPEDNRDLRQPRMNSITGKAADIPYRLWGKGMEERLSIVVGPQAAKYAMLLVRPQPDGWEFSNKEEANSEYYRRIEQFPQVVIIKGFDRLHNGRTLWAMPEKNQIATIESTVRTYKPMLERVREYYPRVVDYLLVEIDKALAPLAEELGMDYYAI